ncbi:MAG TPA: lipid-binding SYLF domain-containing protein [Candidatus Didemnitutus sp.]|nr:lipid-binding SYLF domain-containing protein [Candidatus Didemnitutus sp.]
MKKFLPVALCVAALLAAALPGRAADVSRTTLISRLDTCEAILQDIQSSTKTAIPREMFQRARAIVIVNQVQAGFFVGVKDGYAVALVKRPNGQWSVPAFLNAGEASIGFQAGARAINTVLLIMDDATVQLLLKRRFNIGLEAHAEAGIRTAEAQAVIRPLPAANVYVYGLQEGLYLSAAVKTGYMSPNDDANRVFYNSNNRLPELLFSDWTTPPPEVHYLRDYLTRLSQ